jgi:ribose transport system substrate-binding protein
LVSDGIKEEASRLGVDLVFCDSEIDAAKALACAQNFEVQGVQGVLNFQVFQESSPEICAAHGDVPVIAIDIIQPPCQTAFMGANNRLAGQLGGRALGEFIKNEFDCDYTAYVSLESTAAGAANTDRMGGYREGFQEFCPLVNERILDGADRTDPALEQMTNTLTALPGERIVVVAINEDGILGAIGAANTLGRETDLYYSGQGTDPSIWCDIQNNPNYIASVAYFPERYGTILIPAILNAVEGNAIAGQLFTDHLLITSENLSDVYDVGDCG